MYQVANMVVLRDLGNNFVEAIHASDLSAVLSLVCMLPLGSPRAVARVHTGQVIMSSHTKLQNKEHVIGALCRAKSKFPIPQRPMLH